VETCLSGLFEWVWGLLDKETVWTHVGVVSLNGYEVYLTKRQCGHM